MFLFDIFPDINMKLIFLMLFFTHVITHVKLLHLLKNYEYFDSQSYTTIDSLSSHIYMNVIICKLKRFGSHFTPVKRRSQKIVTDEDENRKITTAEALKKLDEVKNFIKVNGSDHLNMILNEFLKMCSK